MKFSSIIYVFAFSLIALFPEAADGRAASGRTTVSNEASAVPSEDEPYTYFLDDSRSMTPEEIAALNSSEWMIGRGRMTPRNSESRLWMKMRLVPESPAEYHLTEHFGADEFDAWILEDGSSDLVYAGRAGWLFSGDDSAVSDPVCFSSIPLGFASSRPSTIFISLSNDFVINPHFILMTDETREIACVRSSLAQGIAAGFSAFMILFALVVLVSSPRIEYAVYFLLSLAIALNVLYYSGFGPLLLWRGLPAVSEVVRLAAPLLFFAVFVRFFRSMLLLSPKQGFGKFPVYLESFLYIAIPVVFVVPHWVGFALVNIMILIAVIAILVLLISAEMMKMTVSKIPLAAWGLITAVSLFLSAEYAGIIPYVDGIYNNNHLLSGALLTMSAMFGATIVAQSEYTRTHEAIRRMEAEARGEKAREQLVDSDRMNGLESSVSIIAHEMGGPLGSVRLLGSEIEDRAGAFAAGMDGGSKGPEEIKGFLAFAEDSGRMISETVRSAGAIMEGFKTITADQATLRTKTVDIGEYIERISRLLRLKVARTPHSLVVDSPAGLTITTVPGYVSQIVTNLVSNALNHAFEGGESGTITLTVEAGEGDAVLLSVSDDGTGVPEDDLEKIFEMFYTTAADADGTGLGLAISRHLAETKLNGRLEVDSKAGSGTTFRLTLGNLAGANET